MKTGQTFFLCLFFSTILLAVGCQRVNPKPPEAKGFDEPIPATTSYLTGRITFELADLEKKINDELGVVLVTEETLKGQKGEKWQLRVERSGPVRLRYSRGRVSFTTPLRVWISNPLAFKRLQRKREADPDFYKSKRPLCALTVNFDTPLKVNNNWSLTTKARFVDYQWIEKPKVRVLGVGLSIQRIAERILDARKQDIEMAIDKAVSSELHLEKEISKIWRDIQRPLLLNKQPDSVWLVPTPSSVIAGPIVGNQRYVTIPLRIGFSAATRFGPRPAFNPSLKLPVLRKVAKLEPVSDLKVLFTIPFADLNRVISQNLSKRELELKEGLLKIKRASLYGGQRSLILKTEVGGAVKGTLYLHGRPYFDTLTNTLQMRNVDFDVHTEERLLATADWLLHDDLRDTLQTALKLPLGDKLAAIPDKIETAFARGKAGKKTDLDIAAFRLVPQRIAIRPDGVQILIDIKSKVTLQVEKL
ncbi:DUF4403 family protein [Rudanella lutea]|uniref:DUF4403 family protein n=1 Tax=Rudanella lutea TaxID=451374 RepID=UPI000380F204|nr:DUF4403 family protein [Rudanella lutea]